MTEGDLEREQPRKAEANDFVFVASQEWRSSGQIALAKDCWRVSHFEGSREISRWKEVEKASHQSVGGMEERRLTTLSKRSFSLGGKSGRRNMANRRSNKEERKGEV